MLDQSSQQMSVIRGEHAGLTFATVCRVTPDELKARTRKFSLDVVKVARGLTQDVVARQIVGQLVRSGTAVGANYRSCCRARSDKEFISRLGVVEDEADETLFWLQLLVDDGGAVEGCRAVDG